MKISNKSTYGNKNNNLPICIFSLLEIKCERDAAIKNLNQMKQSKSTCTSCGQLLGVVRTVEDSADVTEACGKTQAQPRDTKPEEINVKGILTKSKVSQIKGSERAGGSAVEDKDIKTEIKSSTSYRSLSRLPRNGKPKLSKTAEGKSKILTPVVADEPIILVPETISMDENKLYLNLPLRKALATQTTSVPETLAIENTEIQENYMHGNTDFCKESSNIKAEISGEKDECALDSSVDIIGPSPIGRTEIPDEKILLALDSSIADSSHQSPVLGKKNVVVLPGESLKSKAKIGSPKVLNFEDTRNKLLCPLEISNSNSDDGKSGDHLPSTPRYSPLVFTHNISLNDSDTTSPSLLATGKNKPSRCTNENMPSPSRPLSQNYRKDQDEVCAKTKTVFRKSHSNYSMSPPKKQSRSLRRIHTSNNESKGSGSKLTIVTSDGKKKNLKQTKLSPSIFQPKTNVAKITGSKLYTLDMNNYSSLFTATLNYCHDNLCDQMYILSVV